MRPRTELTAMQPTQRIGSDLVRAVLIVNPNATSTTPAGRDLLAHALESRTRLTVVHTDHRGHAIEIARDATRDGVDVLIVHGGDGTVNEVVNGILGERDGVDPGAVPAVGVVPGAPAYRGPARARAARVQRSTGRTSPPP